MIGQPLQRFPLDTKSPRSTVTELVDLVEVRWTDERFLQVEYYLPWISLSTAVSLPGSLQPQETTTLYK